MKKLTQTPEEYYNRRTTADFLEEELRSMQGCRRLARVIIALVVIALLIIAFKLR